MHPASSLHAIGNPARTGTAALPSCCAILRRAVPRRVPCSPSPRQQRGCGAGARAEPRGGPPPAAAASQQPARRRSAPTATPRHPRRERGRRGGPPLKAWLFLFQAASGKKPDQNLGSRTGSRT
eukprot:gene16115-biopygen5017